MRIVTALDTLQAQGRITHWYWTKANTIVLILPPAGEGPITVESLRAKTYAEHHEESH